MNDLSALLYADWRGLVNDVRRGLRSRGRVIIWVVNIALLVGLFWTRVALRPHHAAAATADLARADYFMCTLLVTSTLLLATGAGAIGIFRSRAEARFIVGSPIAAPIAIAYLQTREAFGQALRLVTSLFYLAFVFGPRHLSPLAFANDMLLVVAMLAASAALVVPRRLLPRPAGIACVAAGLPLAALAGAPALRDALGLAAPALGLPPAAFARIVAVIPPWHPGHVLLQPSPLWPALAVAVAFAAVALLAASGRDAYPELYALSLARIDRIERLRARAARSKVDAKAVRAGVRARSLPAPAGVLVFVWKSVVEFRRLTAPALIAGGALVMVGAGFAGARFSARYEGVFGPALFAIIANLMLVFGIGATAALAAEVRRPLFWLSSSALFERLCALALARIWRAIFTLELIAAGFVLGGGGPVDTLIFAVALPVLAALLVAVGFAAFALFPMGAGVRGPAALLRIGFSILLLVPPFALGALAGALFSAVVPGLLAAALLALIEAGALIGVAAWRLDGHVDRLAA